MQKEDILLHEKYRPQKIADCVLPADIKKYLTAQVKQNRIKNMVLIGSHGVGKTTAARALCLETNADFMFLNCSKDRSINDVRDKIDKFANNMSIRIGAKKVLIGDEFDHFTPDGQAALRGVIEAVSSNCRFIFTCNYPNKIIEPIRKSRMDFMNFTIPKEEKPKLVAEFFKRCVSILEAEGIQYDKKVLGHFVLKKFPDFRRTIEDIDRAIMTYGEINASILNASNIAGSLAPYIEALKKKDYQKARAFIGESMIEPAEFFRGLFNVSHEVIDQSTLANAILILDKYQFQHAFAVDHELNLAALTIELMASCQFK